MFNAQEQQIIEWGKQNKKSRQDVEKALLSFRMGQKPKTTTVKQGTLSETFGDIKETGSALKNTYNKTIGKMGEAVAAGIEGKQSGLRTLGQAFGAGAGGISQGIGDVITGGAKALLSQENENKIKQGISSVVEPVIKSNPVQNIITKYESLNPQQKRDVDALVGVGSFILDITGLGVGKKAASTSLKVGKEAVDTGVDITKNTVKNTVEKVKNLLPEKKSITESGLFQKGKELVERAQRGVINTAQDISDAKIRAERIRNATPAISNAIKAEVPEVFIENITKADQPTLKAMKETIAIAEAPKKLGVPVQPSTVSGNLAVKQFKIIDNQRKIVGAKLGNAVNELSQTVTVPMKPAYDQLDNILAQIDVTVTDKGLDFSKAAFSNAQKTKISELYKLAREGGETLTPAQLYKKDQLFSQLSREAIMDKIGDVKVALTGTGETKSLFGVFKDVYAKTLDSVSPQDIRAINKEYRQYRTMVDAIEDALFRGADNLDDVSLIKKNPAAFAKVNLRRIFAENINTPTIDAVTAKMDELSRTLGYADASPSLIAGFANELRELYPNTIPSAGFQGGIRMGVGDIANSLISIGKIAPKDQQKALRELIESLYDNKASMINPKIATPIAAQTPKNSVIKSKTIAKKQPIVSKVNNKPTSTLPQNKSNVKSGNQAIQAQLSENALIKEAKKYKTVEEFVNNYDGGLILDRKKVNKWISGGPNNTVKVSEILGQSGKKFMKDMNLPDIPVRVKEAGEDTIGYHAQIEWDKTKGIKSAQIDIEISPTEEFGVESLASIETDLLHELSHAKQLVLGRLEGEKVGSKISEASAQKHANYIHSQTKSQLIDIWNKANK